MTKTVYCGLAFATILAASVSVADAASIKTLKMTVDSFKNEGMIPNKFAFCNPAAQGHSTGGPNINPRVAWSKGPRGTKSYAILLYDTDSPAEQREKMNKEGETLTAAVKRRTFYHWILVDIPAKVREIPEGAESKARIIHGNPAGPTFAGVRGLNDFTKIFAANEAMKGQYYGYNGPCPPWNDENLHHMHFTVYALSVESLGLPKDFDGEAVMKAMEDKVLAKGELLGLYTQNPAKGAVIPK